MLNKNNILRFLIVVLFLSTIAIATETTWRHSGFEISGFDMNGSSTYNLTEIRKIEFGWNTSIPAVSDTSRAVMYYDDNQKRIMQSLNGGAYQAIVDNTTVNAYTVNAANATGVLPNASIPLSAYNISSPRVAKLTLNVDRALVNGVTTKVDWDAVAFSEVITADATTDNITIPATGYYRIEVSLRFNASATNADIINIRNNGVNVGQLRHIDTEALPVYYYSTTISANTNDWIDVTVQSNQNGQGLSGEVLSDYIIVTRI